MASVDVPQANIGVVGLAVMGSNLARNLASREGNTVAVFNRTTAKTEELVAEHPEAGFIATTSYREFADRLSTPRTAIIMVQAGRGTDAVIDELVRCSSPATSSSTAATRTSTTPSRARSGSPRPASTSSAPASPGARRVP
jgi:3-hydroxyisobutyrate dehydrogenase-like beta-hydroxyacid dehydrogenase